MQVQKTGTCHVCKLTKDAADFYLVGSGLSWSCRACHREWARRQRRENPGRESARVSAKRATRRAEDRTRFPLRPTPLQSRVARAFQRLKVRNGYRRRKVDFDLRWLYEQFADFVARNHYELKPRHPFLPSVDRIDGARGYTKDNVRIVWLIENYCRNSFTDADVLEFCRRKLASAPP